MLQRWIGAVDQLADDEQPDAERMRAVAIELGLPEDIVELAEQRAAVLRDEALHHQRQGRHTAARATMQRALELVPWSASMRAELEGLQGPPAARVSWGLAALGLVAVALVAMWVARPSGTSGSGFGLPEVPSEAPRVVAPRAAPQASVPLPPGPSALDLPLRVVGELPAGAVLLADTGYRAYHGQGSWNVSSAVRLVAGEEGIAEARFRADLVDAEGVITSGEVVLIGDSDPAVFEGERAIDDLLLLSSVHRVPEALVLTVERVQIAAGRGLYGVERPITGVPQGVGLVLHERQASCARSALLHRVTCKGVFVAENTGEVALKTLKLRVRFGTSSSTDETWVVASRDAPLAPGDRQPVLFIEIFEGEVPDGPWTFEAVELSTP